MFCLSKNKLICCAFIFTSFVCPIKIAVAQTKTQSPEVDTTDHNTDSSSEKTWLIDKIIVLVNGARILKSDLEKPRILKDGQPYSLDELIEEEILVQKAIERHMLPTEADIERHVVAFKMQNGLGDLSKADFEEELKKFGFTLKEYKFQMSKWLASDNLRRMEVTDKIVVTSQEVENYYKNNPETTPEEYYLKMIPVQIDSNKRIDLKREDTVDLNWIKKEDIDPKFEFVLKMKKGQISEPVNVNNKDYVIELFNKKESKTKTLDERYSSIEKLLIQKKQAKLISKFYSDLKKNSTIIYL